MAFTTFQFILFFVIVFFGYWAIPPNRRWWLLLAASWFFYAFVTPYYLIFLGTVTVCTYLAALALEGNLEKQKEWISHNGKKVSREEKKHYKNGMERRRKWILLCVTVLTIGLLFVFKYLEFLFVNVNWLMGAIGFHSSLPAIKLMLPIGLSFYVFQSLGYCIDVQREIVSVERNFFKHALFVSYFPQILQGPIGDYARLAPQFFENKSFIYGDVVFGIQRVAWGFFKKLMIANIIADRINPVWTSVGEYHGFVCWSVILFLYSIQLYADFSGYMDIACGCSQMLGIKLDENFTCPYFTKNIAEFWRKWHITLGVWFKNYIFYPLLRSDVLTNLRKRLKGRDWLANTLPTIIALFIVWLLIGLWHGADWSYVIYGLYHGSFIMLAIAMSPIYEWFHGRCPSLTGSRFYAVFQMARTFLIVMLGYAIFKPADLASTYEIFQQMFSGIDGGGIHKIQYTLHHSFIKAFLWMTPMLVVDIIHYTKPKGTIRTWIRQLPLPVRWAIYIVGLCLITFYGVSGSAYDRFEYFQF